MLKFLRKKNVQRRFLIAAAILIIPAFVFWGTGTDSRKEMSDSTVVGRIGAKSVKLSDLLSSKKSTQIQLVLNYIGQQDVLDKLLKDRDLMNKLSWDRLVMVNEANERGIKVSDKEVIGFITSQPLFVRGNVFDEKFYKYFIQQSIGVSERVFEESLRESIKIMKLRDIILSNVSVSDDEALAAYKRETEKGKITYILLNNENFESQVPVTDEDINAYYQAHKKEFIVPERINLEYMSFPYANGDEKAGVMNFVKPVLEKISKKQESFSDAAKENGRDIQETGIFTRKALPQGFNVKASEIDGLFALDADSISILSDQGLAGSIYIVRIKDKKPAEERSLENVRKEIESDIRAEKSATFAFGKAEELIKAIDNKVVSMEDAAVQDGLKSVTTKLITRFDYVEGVGEASAILDKIFSSELHKVTGPYKTRKGYMIARMDEFQPVDTAAFEKDKETFRNKVLTVKKAKAMQDWFEKASLKARITVDFKQL